MARFFPRSFLIALALGIAALVRVDAEPAAGREAPPVAEKVRIGNSVVALYGPWKFQAGDSPVDAATGTPVWAMPGYDDSKWESVDLRPVSGATDPISGLTDFVPGWTLRGHPGYWGWAWYRIRVRVESRSDERLAVAGPADMDDAYQFFTDGALTGSFGDFSREHPLVQYTRPMMFVLPEAKDAPGGASDGLRESTRELTRVLAFRVWMNAYTLTQSDDAGGFHTAPLLGDERAISNRHQVLWEHFIRTYFTLPVQFVVFGVLGLLALSLVLFDRTDRVYLWIGSLFLLLSVEGLISSLAVWSTMVSGRFDVIVNIITLHAVDYGIWVMIWRSWFQRRRSGWIAWSVLSLVVLLIVATMYSKHGFETVYPDSVTQSFTMVTLVVRFALAGLMLFIVIQGIRRQGTEGWLALPAVLLAIVSEFYGELQVLHILPFWFPFGVRIRIPEITNALLVVVLSVLLLRRLLLSIEHQRSMALDVKQAQEVQQLLIPESIPEVDGFTMQAVYKPAGEVGGDFFQILPVEGKAGATGGVLIVIGDVSGKGMPAAMTVSLLVGTVRTLAHYTQSPREILTAMNARMLSRTSGGFTTCLVIFADANGIVIAANAGHISPYLNGKELFCENGLPLGLTAETVYSESRFELPEDGQITLMTDGVPEARSRADGALFGFERTAAISTGTAEEIAEAARAFGQDDDITVLTLTRIARSEALVG